MNLNGPIPNGRAKLEERLQAEMEKRAAAVDPEVIAGLDLRIADLKRQISLIKDEVSAPVDESEELEIPPEPTPEQRAAAENLVRQARVAKMRGQTKESLRILEEARAAAPGSAAVIELLADERAAAGHQQEALRLMRLAIQMSPGNVALERKHASLVFLLRAKPQAEVLSMEMRQDEVRDNARMAGLCSLLLPGLGQAMMGEVALGAAFAMVYIISIVWMLIAVMGHHSGPVRTGQAFPQATTFLTAGVVVPLVIALVVQVIAFTRARSKASAFKTVKVKHPEPPVNLPFD